MDKAEPKDFGNTEEMREFPTDRLELVRIGGTTVGRASLQPRLETLVVGSADGQDQKR